MGIEGNDGRHVWCSTGISKQHHWKVLGFNVSMALK